LRDDHSGDSQGLREALFSRQGIVEKWNINLLAALVLSGGRQRPQVYAQLEVPELPEIEVLTQECSGNKQYILMRAGL
jgi:hypothetical protein